MSTGIKIIFVCGSLEPGKDGVGDYVRLLAGDLLRLGFNLRLIALNDRHAADVVKSKQQANDVSLCVTRYPAAMPERERYERAADEILFYKPDLISLQFVPYSFHAKGLPFSFRSFIRDLSRLYAMHIMFHELWLDKPENIGQHLVARLQRHLIAGMISQVHPNLIHVSMPFNRKRLESLGLRSHVLPLFGNIPYAEHDPDLPAFEEAADCDVRLLFFGSAPKGDFLQQIIRGVREFCAGSSCKVAMSVASGNSAAKDQFVGQLRMELGHFGVRIVDLGFLTTEEISFLMKKNTVGIGRSNADLLGKSGSAIAMLEHGLPLWLPKWKRDKQDLSYDFRRDRVFDALGEAVACTDRPGYAPLLRKVTNSFISQINLTK